MVNWDSSDLRNYQNRQKRPKQPPEPQKNAHKLDMEGFGQLIGVSPPPPIPTRHKSNLSVSESTDESKLNKTERAYLAVLRSQRHQNVRVQAITLKLADDCRLTVDFTYLTKEGEMVFVDVKGWQREDALIKMKVAARQFPEFRFQIVKKSGIGWAVDDVKP